MEESSEAITLEPQPGPQTRFHETEADIAIYGGAAGSGKSFALLFDPLRHLENPKFAGVIFRRTTPEIRNPGGLWDESTNIYGVLGTSPRQAILEWKHHSGWRMKFSHMEHEKDKYAWQGSQMPYVGFDEITHFTQSQVFYMMSRNRSTSGIAGYLRGTCNPDPDSWVAPFISWWIDQETGYAVPERSGKIRHFIRVNNEIHWADTREELIEKHGRDVGAFSKSFTFIPASIHDNKILLDKDPAYLANLKALSLVDRERLLGGNWKIRASAGNVFRREWFEIVDHAPSDNVRIRYWDRASTEAKDGNDPDYSVGTLVSRSRSTGLFYVEHVVRMRETPYKVEEAIKKIASQDGPKTQIGIEQDPGSAGVFEANYYVRALAGYNVRCYPVTKDKVTRANPVSAQAEAGNIKIVSGTWNKAFFDELENFPGTGHDDQVDSLSGGFAALTSIRTVTPRLSTI